MNTITFRGVITDGVGKYVELHVPGRNEISQAPDDWPVTLQKGSLNVHIEPGGYPSLFASAGLPVLVKSLDARPFPAAFEIAQHELGNNRLAPTLQMPHRGSAQVWRALLLVRGERHPCWVLRRFGSGVGEQLELLSHLHMRSSFKLVNGERVEVVMQRGNAHQADGPQLSLVGTPKMNDILDQSLECLRPHLHAKWGDRCLLDVFNRLLAKNIRPPGWTKNTHADLQRQLITSRKEQWATAALGKLTRGHNSQSGDDFGCPIILAEYQGMRVLDGNHRINRWVASSDMRTHAVHIHTVVGPMRFIELPSVAP